MNPDVFEKNVGEFLNCPNPYFALKSSCRLLHEHMGPACPVTMAGFLDVMHSQEPGLPWLPVGIFDVGDEKMRLVRKDESLGDIVQMVEKECGADAVNRHLFYLVDGASVRDLATLEPKDLTVLLSLALSEERLAWIRPVVGALKLKRGLELFTNVET